LGLALARRLLETDHRLILTARESSVHRFADSGITESANVRIRPLDVVDPDQREAVVREANQDWDGVDVLVNNAGVSYRSVVEDATDREGRAQMAVNFLAPMGMARLVLPRMRAKRRGHVINVSSVGGMMAMPTMAVYSASKFALEGATEALWYEVRPWNIAVSLVQPGFIHSQSFERVRFTSQGKRSAEDEHAAYHAHYENMGPFIARMMRFSRSTPDKVARKIVWAMNQRRPPLRVPATWDAHAFSLLRRLLPRELYHQVLYWNLPRVRTWGPENRPATVKDFTAEEEAESET
jgi:short-subunit dehydrogenase